MFEAYSAPRAKRQLIPLIAGLLVAMGPAVGPAAANPLKSLYTTLEIKSCRVLKKHAEGNAYLCGGLGGYAVYFAEGDLRTFVSFGRAPEKRRAASQTLGDFNTVFGGRAVVKGKSAPSTLTGNTAGTKAGRATIEWRFVRRDGKPMPYATILRYFTSSDENKSEVLVVTKVSPTEACHVAYVDAIANSNAIVLAREAADKLARTFDCSKEPGVIGSRGRGTL